jgi:polyphosphate kinase
MQLSRITLVRLTRDAEVALQDDSDETLPELVREQIRQRRYEPAVRLEFGAGADPAIRQALCERFKLEPLDTYDMPEEVDYTALFEIASMPIPELCDTQWRSLPPPPLADCSADIFDVIRAGDLLVHHPYESFDSSVEHFVATAADDPQTIAIKMTAYRIGDDTPFVRSLVRAAEAGKQVACVMEIKARFDEERNLHWAAELESAGAHVIFGVRSLKTHAKTILWYAAKPMACVVMFISEPVTTIRAPPGFIPTSDCSQLLRRSQMRSLDCFTTSLAARRHRTSALCW